MVTRRTAVGTGLAFTAMAWTAGFGAYGATARRSGEARPIDALLIDEGIETPRQMAALIETGGRALPVVGFDLGAAGQAPLMGVLDKSSAIAGISSGATLFCLERIAWDHGFRLTARGQWRAGDRGDQAGWRDVAAILSGAQLPAADPAPLVRDYRPSRADGLLHAWIMHKSSPQFRQLRREA